MLMKCLCIHKLILYIYNWFVPFHMQNHPRNLFKKKKKKERKEYIVTSDGRRRFVVCHYFINRFDVSLGIVIAHDT